MILEEETFERFGYRPSALNATSKKRVLYQCPSCKGEFETAMHGYRLKKTDYCKPCSLKRRNRKIPPKKQHTEAVVDGVAKMVAQAPVVDVAPPAPIKEAVIDKRAHEPKPVAPTVLPSSREGVSMDPTNPRILSVAEMSRISGVAESYLSKCVKVGHLSPSVHAVEAMEAVGGQEQEAAAAKDSDNAFHARMRHVVAEEVFERFWKSIYGKQRLCNPVCIREVENLSRGFPADYVSHRVEKHVEKTIANIYTAMGDDEMHELTETEVMDARETA